MISTPKQPEFIRAHGITHCPPSPKFRVSWGGSGRKPGHALSEEDFVADLHVRGTAI